MRVRYPARDHVCPQLWIHGVFPHEESCSGPPQRFRASGFAAQSVRPEESLSAACISEATATSLPSMIAGIDRGERDARTTRSGAVFLRLVCKNKSAICCLRLETGTLRCRSKATKPLKGIREQPRYFVQTTYQLLRMDKTLAAGVGHGFFYRNWCRISSIHTKF